jgi:hypothetical protein
VTPTDPPSPWRPVAQIPVGGLHSIGFVNDTENLLVVSQDGRGLLHGSTGDRVSRDRDTSWTWYDADGPRALGIGPYEGTWVPVAGLDGGHLPTSTSDGWRLVVSSPNELSLAPPEGTQVQFSPRWSGEELRAFGFSDSGKHVAVAVGSHTVELYKRYDGVEQSVEADEAQPGARAASLRIPSRSSVPRRTFFTNAGFAA